MQEYNKKGELEIYEIAPNGTKVDRIFINKVPNIDNSGWVYIIDFKEAEHMDRMRVGTACLILGSIEFVESEIGDAVSYQGLRMLSKWIEENLEEV